MKRFLTVLLLLSVVLCTIITAYAADNDAAVTGKTVISTDDVVYEIIDNGTRWEVDEYIGEGGVVEFPSLFNGKLLVAIGDHAFANNTNVTEVITWPPLYRIEDHAFVDCTTLRKIQLNYTTEFIGMGAFSGTAALKEINLEGTVVKKIEPYAFLNSGIGQVTLPDTCEEIGYYAFAQCASLEKVVIPYSVTTIDDDAFTLSDNLVIYCYAGSYAQEYAIEHNIPYVLIGEQMTVLLGDADDDGEVSVLDVTVIQRVLADMISDDDGRIALRCAMVDPEELTITDATVIQRYLAMFAVQYPVETEATRILIYK